MDDLKTFEEVKNQGFLAMKMFNAFQKEHANLVFYMSRSYDTKLYGYFSNRNDNALIPGKEVDCASINPPDWRTTSTVPDYVLKPFFALHVAPISGTKKYSAKLAGFPDRTMTLHLKKDNKPNDGLVTSTSIMHVDGHTIQDVRVICMHKIMTFNAAGIPDIKRIIAFGTVAKDQVPAALHSKLPELSKTQCLVWEDFPVTDELLKRFDIASLTAAYLFSSK